MKYYILFLGALAAAAAQQYTTPVPILKQINRHNEDGSYSYGYEGADGSYKIESKYANGEVYGKYGYVDNLGKLREIEYGASRRGFEPQGNEINVAPPTITDDKYPVSPLGPGQEDDGQYREDPSIYYKDEKFNQNPPQGNQPLYRHSFDSTVDKFGPKYTQPSYQKPYYQQPSYEPAYQPSQPSYQEPEYQEPAHQQPAFRPTTKFSFDDFISNRPQSQPDFQPSYYTPAPPAYTENYGGSYNQNYGRSYNQNYGAQYAGHPAANVDLNLGSYTVNYKRR